MLVAVSVVCGVPRISLTRLFNEVVVIRGVDTRCDNYRLRPAHRAARTEGLVGKAEHDALVVGCLYAGIAPCERAHIGEGIAAHLGNIIKNSEPLAGDRISQRCG